MPATKRFLLRAIQRQFPEITRIEFNLTGGESAYEMCTAYAEDEPLYVVKPGGPPTISGEVGEEEYWEDVARFTEELNELASRDPWLPYVVTPFTYITTSRGYEYEIIRYVPGKTLLQWKETGTAEGDEIVANYGIVLAHLLALVDEPLTPETMMFWHNDAGSCNMMFHDGRYYYIDCNLAKETVKFVLGEMTDERCWFNYGEEIFKRMIENLPDHMRDAASDIVANLR
jgi:hypothetical protein